MILKARKYLNCPSPLISNCVYNVSYSKLLASPYSSLPYSVLPTGELRIPVNMSKTTNTNSENVREIINVDNIAKLNTEVRLNEYAFLWTISNFESVHLHRNGTLIHEFSSPKDRSIKWCLRLSVPNCDYAGMPIYGEPVNLNKLIFTLRVCNFTPDQFPVSGELKIHILGMENEKIKFFGNKFEFKCESDKFNLDFISRSELRKRVQEILPQDKLRIHVELLYVKKTDILRISIPFNLTPKETPESKLSRDLEQLFIRKDFYDVTISVQGKKYYAHKNILTARSHFFKTMFKSNMQESNSNHINVTDIDENVFQEILRYIYTGKVLDLQNNANELFIAADKYDLNELKMMCEVELCAKLSVDNSVEILILADALHANYLKAKAADLIKLQMRMSKIQGIKSWDLLTTSHSHLLKDIFSSFMKQ